MSDDPFDNIVGLPDHEEVKRMLVEQQGAGDKLDNLIHRVFSQNEDGRELLEIWGKTLIMMPTATPNDDSIQIGINEGTKRFIRNIIVTIEKVDRGIDNE